MFVGQNRILGLVDIWSQNHKFPTFMILIGQEGSGKYTLAKLLAEKAKIPYYDNIGNSVDEVRNIIATTTKRTEKSIYILRHFDSASASAKNAMLKITEEPPAGCSFIMTAINRSAIPATLLSRAQCIELDPYSYDDLISYASMRYSEISNHEKDIIGEVCATPGDIEGLLHYNIVEFYDFVVKVIKNIGRVTGVNAFKIASSLAFKDGDTGYDVKLFLRAVMAELMHELTDNMGPHVTDHSLPRLYSNMMSTTSKTLSLMTKKGINKSFLFDKWILDIRKHHEEFCRED